MSRVQFCSGQAHWRRDPPLTDVRNCVLSISIVGLSSSVNSLPCLMRRLSLPAPFNKRSSFWCYEIDHRAPGYSQVFSTPSLRPLLSLKKKKRQPFFRTLVCKSFIFSGITLILCAELLHLMITLVVHSGEFIFLQILFPHTLFLWNHWFPHPPWQKHKYKKDAK